MSSRFVPGEGPVPCDLMFVGEGPGYEENAHGRPFIGKAGIELDRYIRMALCRLGITRGDCYVTNLVKYQIPENGDPKQEDIERDKGILEQEIVAVRPCVVVSLGRWSTRYFLGDVDMEVVHGLPHAVRDFVVHPVIHPAAGLHNTESQALTWWDFERLRGLLMGKIEPNPPVDKHPRPMYSEVKSQRRGFPTTDTVAVDTEGSSKSPWCFSLSGNTGTGLVVTAPCEGHDFKHIILHNAMHDIGVLRTLGAEYESFDDTMVMAYLLGVEPQGLKALAKRHCGMDMMEYKEVIGDAGKRKALKWLAEAMLWLDKQSSNE